MQICVVCSRDSCQQDEPEDRLNHHSELGEWPRRTAAGTYQPPATRVLPGLKPTEMTMSV